MSNLKISFISAQEMSPELNQQFDTLDRLAFSSNVHENDPEKNNIKWNSACDWFAFGWLGSDLATQLCLVKREIAVGDKKVWVMGVGGVATHPNYQHKGYGSILLGATASFMRDEIWVLFGLLVCSNETRPFYELAYWQFVADNLCFTQDNQRRVLHTSVMILQLKKQAWPAGEIDLCGLPW